MALSLLSVKMVMILTTAGALSAAQPIGALTRHYEVLEMPIQTMAADVLLHKVAFYSALSSGEIEGHHFVDLPAMRAFYEERGNTLFFLSGPEGEEAVHRILGVFEESWTHGLNPSDYNVAHLRRMINHPLALERSALELLLADAVIRYGRDMSAMRIDPALIKQKAKFWRQPERGYDILQKMAAGKEDFAAVMADFAPQGLLYSKLREELFRLSQADNNYDHLLPLDFGVGYFQPGKRHETVVALRARLRAEGLTKGVHGSYYDDELAAATMKFQRQHELEPDGIIGPQTLSLLNLTRQARMEQIITNLERLRWAQQDMPDRYILVNIPSQMLWGIEKGKVALEMPVVVGLPFRQTKSFTTDVTGIRVNPTWTVPLSLKMQDFLPKLKEDPGYLATKGIELIRGYARNAQTLDPHSIDWDRISWAEMGKMRMVQVPGDHNALGRVRVLMQNEYDIYMHDTNHPEYFKKTQRTYSSGCVRLARPYDMARFIIKGHEGWSEERMQALLDEGKTVDVEIDSVLPVQIVYQTIWLDKAGNLVFGADVYKRDKKLLKVLSAQNKYALPAISDARYAQNTPIGTVAINP